MDLPLGKVVRRSGCVVVRLCVARLVASVVATDDEPHVARTRRRSPMRRVLRAGCSKLGNSISTWRSPPSAHALGECARSQVTHVEVIEFIHFFCLLRTRSQLSRTLSHTAIASHAVRQSGEHAAKSRRARRLVDSGTLILIPFTKSHDTAPRHTHTAQHCE